MKQKYRDSRYISNLHYFEIDYIMIQVIKILAFKKIRGERLIYLFKKFADSLNFTNIG